MDDIDRLIGFMAIMQVPFMDAPDTLAYIEEVKIVLKQAKAQQPRVMTLEEALGEDECWIEGRSGACGYGDALISDDGERVDFYRPHCIDTLDYYAYGIVWRCWTSRPTDEQREATPWEN